MPVYRYRAMDANGRLISGTVQAISETEAANQLVSRGLKPSLIEVAEANTVPAPRPQKQTQANAGHYATVTDPEKVYNYGELKDKDMFFFFTQLSSLMKVGIGPSEIGNSLISRVKGKALTKFAEELKASAAGGASISSVMERFPNLFPHHVIGSVRAGETGGYLPSAFEDIAEYYNESANYKRIWWFMRMLGWNGILTILYIIPAFPAFTETGQAIVNSGGAGLNIDNPSAQGIMASMLFTLKTFFLLYGKYALMISIPINIIGYILLLVFRKVFGSNQLKKIRHQLALKMWYQVGDRIKAESLAFFSRNLSRLYNSGIPPDTAWQLAVDTVPNLAVAEKLNDAGQVLRTGAPLNVAFDQMDLFSFEQKSVIASGVQSGDITKSLDVVTKIEGEQYQRAVKKSKTSSITLGCFYTVIIGILIGIMFVAIMMYGGLKFSDMMMK